MARTLDKRANAVLCGAKKKNGDTCRNYAGYGTDHKGVGTCKFHFGNTEAHRKHAVKVEAKQRLLTIGHQVDIDPINALLWTVRISAGHCVLIQSELEKFDNPLEWQEGKVLLAMWDEERDRLAKTSKLAVDAGVAEKAIRLAETYGELLARLIQGILGDLHLTAAQNENAPAVVRKHLVLMDAGRGAELPAAN